MEAYPGFETESSEGIHVLCLFDPEAEVQVLNDCLAQIGLPAASRRSDSRTQLPVSGLVTTVQERCSGLCIVGCGSHKGLTSILKGKARTDAWKHPDILAVQVSPTELAKPKPFWELPDYARERPMSRIVASDTRDPSEIGEPEQWVRFDAVTLDGLRQAFLDPEARLRRSDPAASRRGGRLVRAHWEGGLLAGSEVDFNDALNCVIGGRGSGKSSLIETIRYAVGQESGGGRERERRELRDHVFAPPAKLTVTIRSGEPSRDYLIERVAPNDPTVRPLDNGAPGEILTGVAPATLIAPMFVGQREIAEIAENPSALLDLLDRAGGADVRQRVAAEATARRDLAGNTADIRRRRGELAELESRLAELPGLEHQSRTFSDLGVGDLLERSKRLERERAYVTRVRAAIVARVQQIEQLAHDGLADTLPQEPAEPLEADAIRQIALASAEAARADRRTLAAAAADLRGHLEIMDAAISTWKAAADRHTGEIEADLRKADPGNGPINADLVLQVERRIQALRPDQAKRSELIETVNRLEETRRKTLAPTVTERRRELFEARKACAQRLTASVSNRVVVDVRFEGEREPLRSWLKAGRQGQLRGELQVLADRADVGPMSLAQAIAGGQERLEALGLTSQQAQRLLAERPSDALLELEDLRLPDEVVVELDVGSDASQQMRALADLSPGQRNTALLLLLLHERDDPLVMDQPEDDLDNRFVFEDVVHLLRGAKAQRQFLIATHNANIPVAGDAEQIVVLTPEGAHRARIAETGSIDRDRVLAESERILEGGREAFELRRAKYGHDGRA